MKRQYAIQNQELGDYELHQMYDEMLDEIYPECKIGNMDYSTSRVMKDVDPTAYKVGFSDWLDNEISEGIIIEENDKYYLA
jgi:hypothetical protein